MTGVAGELSTLLLDAHLDAGRGARTAIRCEGRTLTYAELAALVGRTANALQALGVERGQRVATVLDDRPEFIAAFLGTTRIGAVAVPLNTLLRPADGVELLRHCGATALVIEHALFERARPHLASLPDLRAVITVGGRAADALALGALWAAASPDLPAPAASSDDMCFWQYSSGTTGKPKAVMHRHRDYAAITELYGRAVVEMTAEDRSLSASKMFFSYGLGNSLAFPLRYGATAILHPPRSEPGAVFELIRAARPTLFYAVPTFYARMLAAAEADPRVADLSSVRLCIAAGEALPAPLFERWRARFGHEIIDGIGSTEVGYIFISNRPGHVRAGTSGQVVPGYEAKVADAEGGALPARELGDLWVRGPSTFTGYWDDPDATARAIRGDWVVTGDKYTADADGYFRWAGRSDDMLKVGGAWVAPADVEAAVGAHPAVLECAVVGRADDGGLIKPAAFVALRPEATATADEIAAFAAERLPRFMRPRWIDFVAEIPKTATGKIQRYKLRAQVAGVRGTMDEVRT